LKVLFTIHYALVNAIPKNWKACLKNPIPNVTHDTTVNTLRTSSICSSLLNTMFGPPTAETKILRHGFTENTIQKIYLMPFAVINEVKIMFQYKLIHNVLPARVQLYRDGISESPVCNLCNAEEQTLHHHQNFLSFVPGKFEILKEIATAKRALSKFYRTWPFLR